MAHLVIEVARAAVERQLLLTPIEFDASNNPVDILAPPAPLRRTIATSFGTVRIQFIIRKVSLATTPGSAQCALSLQFDEGSIEALSLGQAVGLLAGQISVSFGLLCRAAPVPPNRQVAQLCADFTTTTATFSLDGASRSRLVAAVGGGAASLMETAVATALTTQFRAVGVRPAGLNFNLTPGMASEDLLTVDELPGVVWVNGETLALSLRYAPQGVPPPFQPVPFLPPGQSTAFGMWLSNDGFQRTVRNPAIRDLARSMLSERLIDQHIADAYAARGGTGGITDADRAAGQKRLGDYLATPQGRQDIANEIPAPLGGGMLRKRVKNVPDPFSDFDVEIPLLDLWLGQGVIEGRAVARGSVNGFGFTAHVSFRARPVLVTGPPVAIELRDVQVDEPDLDIDLPFWLEWGVGIIVGRIAGPVMGAIVGFLLADIVGSVAEAFIPSNLGSKVPPQDPEPIASLPQGVSLTSLDVTPERLAIMGSWSIYLDDPRPFWPVVRIVDQMVREPVGPTREGTAWFTCLGVLGIVHDSTRERGTPFHYKHQSWRSRVTAAIDAAAVPLPLTYFPWTIAIGYPSMAMYHFPVFPQTAVPLVAGALPVSADVWLPEPPMKGSVENRQFVIDVQGTVDTQFVLDVPPEAGHVLLALRTKVVDASGQTWELSTNVAVPNATVTFGDDFQRFGEGCEGHRRDFLRYEEPTLLDKVWYPPDVYAKAIQRAIRTERVGVVSEIESLLETHGAAGYDALLAPSILAGRR